MSFEDFVSSFTMLEVCHLGLESLEYNQECHGRRRLQETIFSGAWENGVSAGGGISRENTFWTNPQFSFTITDPDPNDNEKKCFVVIAVMQKGVRAKVGYWYPDIDFALYQVANNHTGRLTLQQLRDIQTIRKPACQSSREVASHYRLSPGTYVVIPCMYDDDREGQFIVRILAQVAITGQELDGENRFQPPEVLVQPKGQTHGLNEDLELKEKFNQLADPQKGTIDAKTLAKLLNESSIKHARGFTGFGKEFCRTLLASVDLNITGQITQSEFMDLWSQLKNLWAIFESCDILESGALSMRNFQKALSKAGFTLSNKVFSVLRRRYASVGWIVKVNFHNFLLCAIRLRSVFETANAQAKKPDGSIIFTQEDYLRL